MRGIQLALVAAHSDRVTVVAMSPDGRHFATASVDTTMRIWSFEKHE
jgi:WD40 repeat protein